MNDNPYQSPASTGKPRKTRSTRSTRGLVMTGGVCLVLAALCAVAAVVTMSLHLHAVANAAAAPKPQELAEGIRWMQFWILAAVWLGPLGLGFLVGGLLIRKPVK
jgi:hypothetical protein